MWGIALLVIAALIYGLVQLLSGNLSFLKTSSNDKDIKAIARVNGDIITNYDLLIRQKIYFLENNMTESGALLQQTRDSVFRTLMVEKLQMQYANQAGAPDYIPEAQQQLDRVAQQNKQTREQTLAMMAKRGISEKNIVTYIATTIRWQSMLYGMINQSNVVTPVDINEQLGKKKKMVGKNIYQTIALHVNRPDKDYLKRVMALLQKNPGGWQRDLADDLRTGRITIVQRADMTPQEFGEPFASQLLQQKAAVPAGSIMGPKYAANNQSATIYILMGGGVVPAMELDDLKSNIALELKDRALQPLDSQMKDKLWREAVIEKF